MFDVKTFTATQVQTSTLNEELGQVKFIFSDKTGTLTKNYMEYKKMSIGKHSYGSEDADKNLLVLKDKYGEISNFNFHDKEFYEHLKSEKHENYENIKNFLLCLSLCNTVFTQDEDSQILYQASSPDEMALLNASRYFDCKFIRREIGNRIILEIFGKRYEYTITHILEYTSDRYKFRKYFLENECLLL